MCVACSIIWYQSLADDTLCTQDLDFEIASNRLKFSKDGKFLAAVGMYPPQVKVYELEQLSMKFERWVTSSQLRLVV